MNLTTATVAAVEVPFAVATKEEDEVERERKNCVEKSEEITQYAHINAIWQSLKRQSHNLSEN